MTDYQPTDLEPEERDYPEATGVDTHADAHPGCKLCRGRGYVSRGERVMDNRICRCVILTQQRRAAEQFINDHFPKSARRMTFANYRTGDIEQNEIALKVARNFVEHWNELGKKKGVIVGFYGEPSSGKTHLVTAMALALVKRYGISAEVLNLPNMLRLEKERFGRARGERSVPSLIQRAIDTDFLVIDDLGAERHKRDDSTMSWASEVIYTILDARIMEERPLAYTTNLNPGMLKTAVSGGSDDLVGGRIWERIQRAQIAPPFPVLTVKGANRQSSEDLKLLID